MKMIVFLMTIMGATVSQAATQSLYCTGGSFKAFTANLESDSSGPGYISLKNARISVGGFAEANLICAGNTNLTGVKCLGFWNDKSLAQVEVSFSTAAAETLLSYKNISGNLVAEGSPWICSIEQ